MKTLREILEKLENAEFLIEISEQIYQASFICLKDSDWENISDWTTAEMWEVTTMESEENLAFRLDQKVTTAENRIYAESVDNEEEIVIHVFVPASL